MSLGEFLTWLQEPNHLKQFLKNPERSMQRQGLAEDDRNLILSGNADEFRSRLEKEAEWDAERAADVLYIVHPGNPLIVHP